MAKLGHISQRLSDIAINYPQGAFVSQYLFPEVPVDKGSDYYTIYNKGNLFQAPDDTISKTGEAREVQLDSGTAEFIVKDRALKALVPQGDIDNADDPLDPQIDKTEVVTQSILLNREIRAQALAASLTTNTSSPSTKWDAANSTPIADIEAAANGMFIRPNTLVMGKQVWDTLKFHADILAAFGGGFSGIKMATLEMIKALFSLDYVVVGSARRSTAKMPKTPSLSYVWGDACHLAYTDNRKAKNIQTFGKLFSQKINKGKTFQTRTWDLPNRGVGGSKAVQVEHKSVEKIIAEDFGWYLSDCLT